MRGQECHGGAWFLRFAGLGASKALLNSLAVVLTWSQLWLGFRHVAW